jgi:cellobiose phosphorylase
MSRVWVEEILDLQVRGGDPRMNPVISATWRGFRVSYRHGKDHDRGR